VEPRLYTDNAAIQARLLTGAGGNYLWVVNPSRQSAKATVSVGGVAFQSAEDIGAERPVVVSGPSVSVWVPPRDAAVVALRADR